jgi:hypothetical protein
MGVFNIRGMELNQAKFGDWMKKNIWFSQEMLISAANAWI